MTSETTSDSEPAYTALYFPQQSPVSINYLAKCHNVTVPAIDEPFSYLDLGCGNGVTLNTLAASRPDCSFVGVDMMPDHIANARDDAARGELTNVEYLELDFQGFLQHDAPQFDYITLHGVYSWVDEHERRNVRDIIARFLKPNGLVYVSYNALPGAAVLAPLRDILRNYTETLSGSLIERTLEGLKYLKFLKDNEALYIRNNPMVGAAIDAMFKQDIRYVAHEYLADTHTALGVSDVAEEMAEISLKFCCGARLGSVHAQRAHLRKFQGILDSRPDDVAREAVKSVILNERFRADIYAPADSLPGDNPVNSDFSNAVFGAAHLKTWLPRTPARQLTSDILKLFEAASPGDLRLSDLCTIDELQSRPPEAVTDLVHHLVTDEHLRPFAARSIPPTDARKGRYRIAHAYNRASLSGRLIRTGRCFLASGVLGDGIAVDMISGLFLTAITDDRVENPISYVDGALKATGREWRRKGVAITEPAERTDLLTREYENFRLDTLPLMMRLGIVVID
jgi:SAM-dependent methyltransferase